MEKEKKKRSKAPIVIIVIVALVLVTGVVWNDMTTRTEKDAYAPSGQIVDVGGAGMHVFATGERQAGEPAVIMLSGLGTSSPVADFYPLWSQIANDYFVAVPERPGYGWSDGSSSERSLENIVDEYKLGLAQAGVEPPYLLVASGEAGLEADLYTSMYPDDVMGVVLIDSLAPSLMAANPTSPSTLQSMMPVLRTLGIMRALGSIYPPIIENLSWGDKNGLYYVNDYYKFMDKHFYVTGYYNPTVLSEASALSANAQSLVETPFPAEKPVTLLMYKSAKMPEDIDPKDEAAVAAYEEAQAAKLAAQQAWIGEGETASALKQIITMEGGHYLHQFFPREIAEAVIAMLEDRPVNISDNADAVQQLAEPLASASASPEVSSAPAATASPTPEPQASATPQATPLPEPTDSMMPTGLAA